MARIDRRNQFMSLSALANGKCKASFQTEGINAFREDKKPLCSGGALPFQVCLEVREDLFTPSCAVWYRQAQVKALGWTWKIIKAAAEYHMRALAAFVYTTPQPDLDLTWHLVDWGSGVCVQWASMSQNYSHCLSWCLSYCKNTPLVPELPLLSYNASVQGAKHLVMVRKLSEFNWILKTNELCQYVTSTTTFFLGFLNKTIEM